MEVGDDVDIRVAPKQQGESQVCASGMVEARDAKWKDVPAVLRVRLDYASLMVGAAGASILDAPKGLKVAPCTVRLMVGERGVYFKGVQKVLKGAHHSAKGTVEENAAFMMVVVSARRVFMGGLITVLPMVEENGVLLRAVQRVHVAALIAVLNTAVENVAGSITAVKVLKGVQITARLTVEGKGACGDKELARSLQEGKVGFVQHMAVWYRIRIQERAA